MSAKIGDRDTFYDYQPLKLMPVGGCQKLLLNDHYICPSIDTAAVQS